MRIPIKAYVMDESLSWEERYRQLEEHHREETEWMAGEIRRLEAIVSSTEHPMVRLHRRVHAVLDAVDEDTDWEPVYSFVFAEYRDSGITFEWHDPDLGHRDDVVAFVCELDRRAAPYLITEGQ